MQHILEMVDTTITITNNNIKFKYASDYEKGTRAKPGTFFSIFMPCYYLFLI